MDISANDLPSSIEAMGERFQERAAAIEKAAMPPLEGLMRLKWMKQKEIDYQDFLMIADCDIELTDGILHLSLDLRPAICDAAMRNSPLGIADKTPEKETQVAMKNIAKASKVIKKHVGLSGHNPNFTYGGESG